MPYGHAQLLRQATRASLRHGRCLQAQPSCGQRVMPKLPKFPESAQAMSRYQVNSSCHTSVAIQELPDVFDRSAVRYLSAVIPSRQAYW